MAKVGRGSEQAMIRLPAGMRDRLKVAADENGRSMNAEIISRLEAYENDRELWEQTFQSGRLKKELEQERQTYANSLAELREKLSERDRMIDRQLNAIEGLTSKLNETHKSLTIFAHAFDELSRGDDGLFTELLNRRKENPLPKSVRRKKDD